MTRMAYQARPTEVRMLPDTLCPECHGDYELRIVRKESLLKRCKDCGHSWAEERETIAPPVIRPGGYIDRSGEL
jgi:hypothetical protein